MSDPFLPDDNVHTESNQQKLDDLWWRVASHDSGGRTVLDRQIAKVDASGNPTTDTTTLANEAAWAAQNIAAIRADIAALKASIPGLVNDAVKAALAGVTVTATTDNNAIAAAVVKALAAKLAA